MNKITTYCNIFYAPPEEAKTYYATRDDLNLTFVNSGNTLYSDVWAKQHCKPDTSGLDTSIWNEWTTLKVMRESDIQTEYLGFCHYRLFPEQLPKLKKDIFVAEGIPMIFRAGGCICQGTIEEGYKLCHIASDWDKLEAVLSKFPTYTQWKSQLILTSPCQMFIMRKDLFNEYFDFAFPILQNLLANIHLEGRDNYQRRAIPFLGERILSFWTYMRQHRYGNTVKAFKTIKFDSFKPSTARDSRGMFG